jgi:hypothetical protein
MEILNSKNKFTPPGKAIVLLLIVLFTGGPWWMIDYTTYLNNKIFTFASIIILTFAVFIIKATTAHKKREIILIALGAHQLALIIKMVIDGYADPTNHNLAPFEMLIILILDSIFCTLGAFLGSWIALISKDK